MKIPVVETCCCGCGLRTGTAIIGLCFAVLNLMELCSSSVYASEATDSETKGTSITQAVLTGVLFALNLMLLWATHKERANWIFPWLIVYTCSFIFTAVVMICFGIFFIFTDLAVGILWICSTIIYMAIVSYCLIVVNSYHQSMIATHLPVPVQEPIREDTIPKIIVWPVNEDVSRTYLNKDSTWAFSDQSIHYRDKLHLTKRMFCMEHILAALLYFAETILNKEFKNWNVF